MKNKRIISIYTLGKKNCFFLSILAVILSCNVENHELSSTAINESSPSKSLYFDWINSNWYGSNEQKVLQNLEFFKWLHDEYGMQLDIYLMDAGNFDNGPNCNGCEEALANAPTYAGLESEWFKNKYPNGLDPIYKLAKSFNCRLGVWIGPDGYGFTDSSAQERINMLTRLVRDYEVDLLKLDRCASDLDPENEKHFIEAMNESYGINPELIVLNHRITLSDSAKKFATTFLWQGAETYIEVSSNNSKTSPHHRYTLERGLPPEMKRLTEDHGVCLSSYLDFWEDELVLQAFNRNLILSPEIYGNPWLLRDDEFPLLARIFNLHRQYNKILVNAHQLDSIQYGPYAVSRGNEKTRFVTLRNLSWEPVRYKVTIDKSLGLADAKNIEVRQHHPYEEIIGNFIFGETFDVEVLPFRTCLLKLSAEKAETGIIGSPYKIVKNIPKQPLEIDLLGMPGEQKTIQLINGDRRFKEAYIDGVKISGLTNGQKVKMEFPGKSLRDNYHRKLCELKETAIPNEIPNFFDAVYFAADNNSLEVRSLERSGETSIEVVKNARDAFFEDEVFKELGTWDKFAFDNDSFTAFKVRKYCYSTNNSVKPGVLRVDLIENQTVDVVTVEGLESDYQSFEVLVSSDLQDWVKVKTEMETNKLVIKNNSKKPIRYVKISPAPWQISEIRIFNEGEELDVSKARASNLFPDNNFFSVSKAWSGKVSLYEIPKNSYLAVAIEGDYGVDGAFAVVKTQKGYLGAYDRSPTYVTNHWEHRLAPQNGNYTYYFTLSEEIVNEELEVWVLGVNNVEKIVTPQVWITAYPIPFEKKKLVLK